MHPASSNQGQEALNAPYSRVSGKKSSEHSFPDEGNECISLSDGSSNKIGSKKPSKAPAKKSV